MLRTNNLLRYIWNPLLKCVRNYPYPIAYKYLIQNQPQSQISQILNGMTVSTEERDCCNVAVGIFVRAGARYECEYENGITHFFEHLAFKGTKQRSKKTIEEIMAAMGARFNCYTGREMTSFVAQGQSKDINMIVDILCDCVFNNLFSASEIELQKGVVYQEMLKLDNDSIALMYDLLHQAAFQGTNLDKSVVGYSGNLYNFQPDVIDRFLKKWYSPRRAILVAVGGVKHETMMSLADRFCGHIQPSHDFCVSELGPYRFTGSQLIYRDDSQELANIALAVEAPCFTHCDRLVLDVASEVVDGWDDSQLGGEENAPYIVRAASSGGLCQAYKTFNLAYINAGLWGVHMMSPRHEVEDMVFMIQKQWLNLCTMVTENETERGRHSYKTRLLTKTSTCLGACIDTGIWIAYTGTRPSITKRIEYIDSITAERLREVCTNYIYNKLLAVAAVGATEGLPDFVRLGAGMYWLRT